MSFLKTITILILAATTLIPKTAQADNINAHNKITAIQSAQNWLMEFTKPSGLFEYDYNPSSNIFAQEDNLVRQIGSYQALIETSHFIKKRDTFNQTLAAFERALQQYKKEIIIDGDAIIYFEDERGEASVNSTAYYLNALLAKQKRGIPLSETEILDIEKSVKSLIKMDSQKGGLYYLYFMPAENNIITSFGTGAAMHALALYANHKDAPEIIQFTDQLYSDYKARSNLLEKPFSDREVTGFLPHALMYLSAKDRVQNVDYTKEVRPLIELIINARHASNQCRNKGCVTTNGYFDSPLFEGMSAVYPVIKKYETDPAFLKSVESYLNASAGNLLNFQIKSLKDYRQKTNQSYTSDSKNIIGGFCSLPRCNSIRNDMTMHAVSGLTYYVENTIETQSPTKKDMDNALKKASKWLQHLQTTSGLFQYEYDRANKTFSKDNNLVRQIGTFWSLIELHQHHPEKPLKETIQNFRNGIKKYIHRDTINGEDIAYLSYNNLSKTNATALYILSYVRLKQYGFNISNEEQETLQAMINGAFKMTDKRQGFYYLYFIPKEKNRISVYATGQMLYALNEYQKAFKTQFSKQRQQTLATIQAHRLREMQNAKPLDENYRAFILWAIYTLHAQQDYKALNTLITGLIKHQTTTPECSNNTCFLETPDPALLEGIMLIYHHLSQQNKAHISDYKNKAFSQIMSHQINSENVDENGAFCLTQDCKTVRIDVTQHNIIALINALKAP